jgi:hypothetical protein
MCLCTGSDICCLEAVDSTKGACEPLGDSRLRFDGQGTIARQQDEPSIVDDVVVLTLEWLEAGSLLARGGCQNDPLSRNAAR